MKTNVIMIRQMGGIEVHQRTDTGMFDATGLLKEWNKKNKVKKEVTKFIALEQTKEFLNVLIEEESLNTHKPAYLTTRGKTGGGTWMHPFLFIKFAMWINPRFEYSVIKFVYDELIKARHEASDMYRSLSSSGMKLKGYNFKEVAKALQWIAFNTTGKNLRQTGTQEQLKDLADTQTKLAFAIDMGFIKSYKHLLEVMRDMWKERHSICPIKQIA